MHRITLALALIGAVAAAGCDGGSATSGGGARGVGEGTFNLTVQNGQNGNTSLAITGGYVISVPAGIDCGVAPHSACSADFPVGSTVVLTATPTVPDLFFQWAGDCFGQGDCTLSGNADRYVLALFEADPGAHPNWSSSAVHAAQYRAFALQCNACHGLNWQGLSIAPSCYGCHDYFETFKVNTDVAATDGHFAQAAVAWTDHGTGWSRACLRCHTSQGFQDYVGVDGTPNNLDGTFNTTSTLTSTTLACETAGTCDPAAYRFGPLVCKTCHNAKSDPVKSGLTQILFPKSLALVTTDRSTALCGQCHQGREAAASIDAKAGTTLPDAQLLTGNSFSNPHYLGAAGTLFGNDAKMWGEYAGKVYSGANQHAITEGKCTSCHDPHTGHLPADADMAATCGRCHFDEATGLPVASFLQLEESRQFGFEGDVDGDGTQESLKLEIEGLGSVLYAAMRAYATAVAGTSIVYDGAAYPYYFIDANNDGIHDVTETSSYNKFTPRLLRAAFTYKWEHAEPGAWAHNPRYAVQVLFDNITELNAGLAAASQPVIPFAGLRTFGGGHFDLSSEAFRHWDGDGAVSSSCAQCHGGQQGLVNYLAGAPAAVAPVKGMECTSCHTAGLAAIRTVASVSFPPAKTSGFVTKTAADFGNANDMICSTCHSGREGKAQVDARIAGMANPAAWTASFLNPHYFGAAATLFGNQAGMWYEYAGKLYSGKMTAPLAWHDGSCVACHGPQASKHTFEVDMASCTGCHGAGLSTLQSGITSLASQVYTTLQAYATTAGNPICYNGGAYPYWFKDNGTGGGTAGNGVCEAGESVSSNGAKLDATALKAAFNYKWSQADPGAYSHNYDYACQVLYDTVLDLGGTPGVGCDLTRP